MIVVLPVSVLLVALSVVVHYGALTRLSRFVANGKKRRRQLIMIGVLGAIAAY